MDINNFRCFCTEEKIRLTTHGLERLQERDISILDVKNCIMNGEIIEECPTDFPNSSCLIFGKTLPATEKFSDDLRTSREK